MRTSFATGENGETQAGSGRRSRRKTIESKGLLIVTTGPGKGKSTAAFGLICAPSANWRIGVVQFVKGLGDRRAQALERFGDQVSWHTLGEGFTWETQDRDATSRRRPRLGKGAELMADHTIKMLVLDELNIALRYEHLPLDEVVAELSARRPDLHVVVTGRNAKPELIAAADLVTEMQAVSTISPPG